MDENLQNYQNELKTLLVKSNDSFEKQLNYISAGSIGVSMLVVEKIIKDVALSSCKCLLIISWIFFTLTLLSNLISHIYTFTVHSNTIAEIINENYDYELATKRNNRIKIWNLISVVLLILGVTSLIFFISKNI